MKKKVYLSLACLSVLALLSFKSSTSVEIVNAQYTTLTKGAWIISEDGATKIYSCPAENATSWCRHASK